MADTIVKAEKGNQQRVDIPVTIDREEVLQSLGKNERTRAAMAKHLDELITLAQAAVKARGMFKVSCVGGRGEDWVEIDGVKIHSRVLAQSLASTDTVFPYIFTVGKELDELPVSPKDYMRYFCLEAVKMNASLQAAHYFMEYIRQKCRLPEITHLHPGEFADLPIEQQVPLFSLFHDTEKEIGVKLTSTKTIQPIKSGSGIVFSNGSSFESCALCLQPHCSGRRVPYSPKLAAQFGLKTKITK
ncbi:MAG: hypothetical protein WC370_00565 [Dehalococcoidales bacterium]|jgi:hypothetical protein